MSIDQPSITPTPVADVQVNTHRRTSLQQAWRRFKRNKLGIVGGIIVTVMVLVALFAPYLAPYDPIDTRTAERLQGPSFNHLLGTDHLGRDILSRVLYGAQISMQVGVAVIFIAAIVGVPLGAISGYWSGSIIDEVIMRGMDIFIAFPRLILAIGVMGALGPKPTDLGFIVIPNLIKIMFVIGIVLAPRFARIMRGSVLKEREEEYVQAARSIGQGNAQILFSEIVPNGLAPIIVYGTYYMAVAILTEASLSFLGIGIQPPTPSWGMMLAEGRGYLISGHWWMSVFPGFAIFVAMMGFNLLGDGLRDVLDPKVSDEGH